jgi:hypothetical protein
VCLKLWALKRKSSIALVTGIIAASLLLLLWYPLIVPFVVASQLEELDTTTTYQGTLEYLGYGIRKVPIQTDAHVRVVEVKGDNIVLNITANIMNITDPSKPQMLSEFSRNSTYVLNKFSRENSENAPEADKPREGYDPLYPPHLQTGEDITDAWLDLLNSTATLKFQGSTEEGGVALYRYCLNKTVIKSMTLPPIGPGNFTLTMTKTILVEPLSGVPAFSENETFSLYSRAPGTSFNVRLARLTYNSTADSITKGTANAKSSYEGMRLLELYIPIIPMVAVVILVLGLALNLRRLRKRSFAQKAQSSATK